MIWVRKQRQKTPNKKNVTKRTSSILFWSDLLTVIGWDPEVFVYASCQAKSNTRFELIRISYLGQSIHFVITGLIWRPFINSNCVSEIPNCITFSKVQMTTNWFIHFPIFSIHEFIYAQNIQKRFVYYFHRCLNKVYLLIHSKHSAYENWNLNLHQKHSSNTRKAWRKTEKRFVVQWIHKMHLNSRVRVH